MPTPLGFETNAERRAKAEEAARIQREEEAKRIRESQAAQANAELTRKQKEAEHKQTLRRIDPIVREVLKELAQAKELPTGNVKVTQNGNWELVLERIPLFEFTEKHRDSVLVYLEDGRLHVHDYSSDDESTLQLARILGDKTALNVLTKTQSDWEREFNNRHDPRHDVVY